MYKIYLAGLSGQSVQFTSLTEAEAAAFALGASDKANIHSPKSRRQMKTKSQAYKMTTCVDPLGGGRFLLKPGRPIVT